MRTRRPASQSPAGNGKAYDRMGHRLAIENRAAGAMRKRSRQIREEIRALFGRKGLHPNVPTEFEVGQQRAHTSQRVRKEHPRVSSRPGGFFDRERVETPRSDYYLQGYASPEEIEAFRAENRKAARRVDKSRRSHQKIGRQRDREDRERPNRPATRTGGKTPREMRAISKRIRRESRRRK